MSITTTYDPDADALQIQFGGSSGVVRTTVVRPGVHLEFDGSGRLVGLEVLEASHVMRADALLNLDDGTEWLSLSDAAEAAKLSASTLRGQLNKGRIVGEKRNRDWVISRHVLETYLDEVEQRAQGSAGSGSELAVEPAKPALAGLLYGDQRPRTGKTSFERPSRGGYAVPSAKTSSKSSSIVSKDSVGVKPKSNSHAKKLTSAVSAAGKGRKKGTRVRKG